MQKPLLPLPNLDDRSYADLVEEALAMIPGLCPEWTNRNPSDPGIALIELMAWLTEMVLYRIDQMPINNYRSFLKLLGTPKDQPGNQPDTDAALYRTILGLRERYRAITREDYEYLAKLKWPQTAIEDILALLLDDAAGMTDLLKIAGIMPETAIQNLTAVQLSKLREEISAGKLQTKKSIQQQFRVESPDAVAILDTRNFRIHRVHCVPRRNMDRPQVPGNWKGPDAGHISLIAVPETAVWNSQTAFLNFPVAKHRIPLSIAGPCEVIIRGEWTDTAAELNVRLVREKEGKPYREGQLNLSKPDGIKWQVDPAGVQDNWYVTITNIGQEKADPEAKKSDDSDPHSGPDRKQAKGCIDIICSAPQPNRALKAALWSFLDERRLLTARHHVAGPVFYTFEMSATLFLKPDALDISVRGRSAQAVRKFFHPLTGGWDGAGFPFGRNIFISEINELLAAVEGVDHVDGVRLMAKDDRRQLFHDQIPVGIKLHSHELVWPDISLASFQTKPA